QNAGNFSIRKNMLFKSLYVGFQPVLQNIGRHSSFKLAVANEIDNGMYEMFINIQKFSKNLLLPERLPYWILKKVFMAVYYLRPFCLPFRTEYPSLYIFSLDNEQTIYRDQNMIYLGCPVS